MRIPTDSTGSELARPIPPLSQSRHGDMACQALYVRKHVQGAMVGESEPAARGIEIHQILATYINLSLAKISSAPNVARYSPFATA